MTRFSLAFILCVLVLTVIPSQITLAKGTPVKGYLVKSGAISSWTGNCSCETQWFTFGANPGKVSIAASMKRPGDELSQQWGIRLVLLRGPQVLSTKTTVCFVGQKRCVSTVRIDASLRQRGVYYLRVDGDGAHQIPFVVRISGSTYSLHCSKTC